EDATVLCDTCYRMLKSRFHDVTPILQVRICVFVCPHTTMAASNQTQGPFDCCCLRSSWHKRMLPRKWTMGELKNIGTLDITRPDRYPSHHFSCARADVYAIYDDCFRYVINPLRV